MSIIGETISQPPTTSEIYPEVIALRWRDGTLEQGRKVIEIDHRGLPVCQGIFWEPVPTVSDER